jgi:hypothetical protein
MFAREGRVMLVGGISCARSEWADGQIKFLPSSTHVWSCRFGKASYQVNTHVSALETTSPHPHVVANIASTTCDDTRHTSFQLRPSITVLPCWVLSRGDVEVQVT